MCGKNRGGAPRGNRNNLIHGGRSGNPQLTVGFWGKRHLHSVRQTCAYRRELISQCERAHGGVGPMHAEWIQLAVQSDMATRVLRKTLATAKAGELTGKDEAAILGQIMNYSITRQRAVGKLALQADDRPTSEWDEIDAMGAADMGGNEEGEEEGNAPEAEATYGDGGNQP